MALLGRVYPIYYAAKNFKQGLTDIVAKIKKPDGSFLGPISLSEISEPGYEGTYFYNYYTVDGVDPDGEYLVIINEPTSGHKAIHRITMDRPIDDTIIDGVSVLRKQGLEAKITNKQSIVVNAGSRADNISASVGNKKTIQSQILNDEIMAFLERQEIYGVIG